MNNKDLLSLISSETEEFLMLMQGISEMTVIPSSVLQLAKTKARNISSRVDSLSTDNQENKLISKNDKYEVEETIPQKKNVQKEDITINLDSEISKIEEIKTVDADKILSSSSEVNNNNLEKKVQKGTIIAEDIPLVSEENATDEKKKNVLTEKRNEEDINHKIETASHTRRVESRFVSSLKKSLNLNDRYRYQKELFDGNSELMNKTISLLDQMTSLDEANDYIRKSFTWDDQNEAVGDFMLLLENRFS